MHIQQHTDLYNYVYTGYLTSVVLKDGGGGIRVVKDDITWVPAVLQKSTPTMYSISIFSFLYGILWFPMQAPAWRWTLMCCHKKGSIGDVNIRSQKHGINWLKKIKKYGK